MESVKLTIDDTIEVFEGETLEEAKQKQRARIRELQDEFKKKHANDREKPAKGVRGFLLWNPFTKKHFFRVYNWQDEELCNAGPVNPHGHKDYKVNAEDIEVEILAGGLSLYENEEGEHRLDWSSQVLGRK